jgi:hypothetical protein
VVYGVEDADLKDGEDADLKDGDCEDVYLEDDDCEDADLEDGRCRRAALLAKRCTEAPPTTLALLHRHMVRSTMEQRHAKRVAHWEREDETNTAHNVDVGPSGASNDDNDDGEAAA